jgi:hypothetical protein
VIRGLLTEAEWASFEPFVIETGPLRVSGKSRPCLKPNSFAKYRSIEISMLASNFRPKNARLA